MFLSYAPSLSGEVAGARGAGGGGGERRSGREKGGGREWGREGG